MIRFRSLQLENFHLARDLTIPFSHHDERRLSLIRAEPGTGKTTVFRAFAGPCTTRKAFRMAAKGTRLAQWLTTLPETARKSTSPLPSSSRLKTALRSRRYIA